MTRAHRARPGAVVVAAVVLGACGGGTASTTGPATTRPNVGRPSVAPLTRVGPSFAVLCRAPVPTTAPGAVTVPDVAGIDLQDAVDHGVCAGLRVRVEPSNASPAGFVIGQRPAGGSLVPIGSTVTLRVRRP